MFVYICVHIRVYAAHRTTAAYQQVVEFSRLCTRAPRGHVDFVRAQAATAALLLEEMHIARARSVGISYASAACVGL